jgi:hypothetical protein
VSLACYNAAMRRYWPLVLAFVPLAACSTIPREACPAGLQAMTRYELFFGRNIGPREGVSDEDWRVFAAAEIAPRFPDGFTVIDTMGQWRDDKGAVAGERGKEMIVIATMDEGAKLDAIRAAYKTRFKQDAVLEVRSSACAGF